MAMVLIFLLMWYFFKKASLVVSPMIVAMVSVISTMGLLVMTGNTVHIMSSMIPIFIMPIAVLDAIHILSDFYDKYPKYKGPQKNHPACDEGPVRAHAVYHPDYGGWFCLSGADADSSGADLWFVYFYWCCPWPGCSPLP